MRILITWRRTQGPRISSLAVDCSWESAEAPPSRSSMVGAILATARLKARTMQIWAGGMPKNFLSYCTARVSLGLIRVQCFPIRQGCYVLSHTLQVYVIESGGERLPMPQLSGQPSTE